MQEVEKHLKLATIWQTKGKFSQAIAHAEQAIQLSPDNMRAYLTLSGTLTDFDKKIALNPINERD